jgi:hypothetical protein
MKALGCSTGPSAGTAMAAVRNVRAMIAIPNRFVAIKYRSY